MVSPIWGDLMLQHWLGSEKPAIVDDNVVWTGNQLLQHAAGASNLLDELCFAQGSAIPVLMDENFTSIALALGAALSRRALAPLGTRLPVTNLVDMVNGLESNYLLANEEYRELAQEVAKKASVTLLVLDEITAVDKPIFEPCLASDTLLVVHTSGTTGKAKPIRMNHAGFTARTLAYQQNLGIISGDRFCSASPFYHVAGAGMVFTALGLGLSVIPQNWFSVEGWQRAGRLGMTYSQIVPAMIDILLEKAAFGDASPRILQYGASPIDPAVLREALQVLPNTRFTQIFGQTEASPLTALSHEAHLEALESEPQLLKSVGKASPNVEIVIEDPDEKGVGQITVRADLCFVCDEDGWRRTGDYGYMDDQGYIYLYGRTNDRIIRGGENIYPVEVEAVLRLHSQVDDVAVVGVPHRRWGEAVKAVIVPKDSENPPSFDELKSFAKQQLAGFKVPQEVDYIDELPRNPAGKVLRQQLV